MSKFTYQNLTSALIRIGHYSFRPTQQHSFSETQPLLDKAPRYLLSRYVDGISDGKGSDSVLSLLPSGLRRDGSPFTAQEKLALLEELGIVVSANAPVDSDGRPDLTVYIHHGV